MRGAGGRAGAAGLGQGRARQERRGLLGAICPGGARALHPGLPCCSSGCFAGCYRGPAARQMCFRRASGWLIPSTAKFTTTAKSMTETTMREKSANNGEPRTLYRPQLYSQVRPTDTPHGKVSAIVNEIARIARIATFK
jgi:hypothetical protein